MGELDLSIKRQMSEKAGLLLTGAVLFYVVLLTYKMTTHKRLLRLLVADLIICSACVAFLPLPPGCVTDAAGSVTLFGIAQTNARYADYLILSANLFVVGNYCKLSESAIHGKVK